MQIQLPENIVSAFGLGEDAFMAALCLMADERGIYLRYGCHPVNLSVVQLREYFGVVLH